MRHPVTEPSLITTLQLVLREPAGIVCIALIAGVIAMAARIASVW